MPFIYQGEIDLLSSDTIEGVKTVQRLITEVGQVTSADFDRIRFEVEAPDLWDLACVVHDLRDNLASESVYIEIDKANLGHRDDES